MTSIVPAGPPHPSPLGEQTTLAASARRVYGLVLGSMLVSGLLNGPLDIALFTIRQRRTDRAWLGRAFAVSMAFNYLGFPVGAVIAGILVTVSIPAAIGVGIGASVVAALAAAFLIPAREAAAAPGGA